MTREQEVLVEGIPYTVVISDETEALLAAKAAGRAMIGLWHREWAENGENGKNGENGQAQDLSAARYLAESPEDIDSEYLEQVVRRTFGLPWIIAESPRLVIREFKMGDEQEVPAEDTDQEADTVFYTGQKLEEYIHCQYGFYEYGIWALVDKKSGKIIGKAGIVSVSEENSETMSDSLCIELGYHIFGPYRRNGYAVEACRAILDTIERYRRNRQDEETGNKALCVCTKIDASNEASKKVAQACGFQLTDRKDSEEGRCCYLYVLNLQ